MSTSDERRWHILKTLYDSTAETVHFRDITGHELGDEGSRPWFLTLQTLDAEGLIHYHGTMDGGSAEIADRGRGEVEERRRLLNDPAERRSGAERGLLQYLYQQDSNGERGSDLRGETRLRIDLAGEILPDDFVGRVAEELKEAGLIEGAKYVAEVEGPLSARLTKLGRKCYESGLGADEFMQRQQRGRPSHQVNIGTMSGGNVNWGDHVTQNATTNTGLVADEIRQLVQAITEALPALNLDDEARAAVARDLEVVEGELQNQTPESRGIVQAAMMRTFDAIQGEGANQLAVYLVTTAKHVLSNVGIEVG